MTKFDPSKLTIDALVSAYRELCVKDYDARDCGDRPKVRRYFDEMTAIEEVLRSRGPEARRALIPLLKDHHAQVRLNTAKALLAVVPAEARATLEQLAAHAPDGSQSGSAGMCLELLDNGWFKPT